MPYLTRLLECFGSYRVPALLPLTGRSWRCIGSKKMAHLRALKNSQELAPCSPRPALHVGVAPRGCLGHAYMWKPHCSQENSPQSFFLLSAWENILPIVLVVLSTPDSDGAQSMLQRPCQQSDLSRKQSLSQKQAAQQCQG